MKKLILLLVLATLGCSTFAQSTQEQVRERKELLKVTKDELTRKATKASRKEAKRLKKEGWTITPGALPIDKQLDKSYLLQYEYDENMYPKYIMGEAMSTGSNYDAAKMQALELAKQNLAGQIQTEVTALIENTVANQQLETEEAETITRSIMASKNLISQNIGRIVPVIELYRTLDNKNKEVLVRIAYSNDMAKQIARKAVHEELEQRGDNLHKKLDKALGL